ncbi:Reelin [Armadillidium vulgare]|nr:Reelin [Armadillidium vulgare]
MGVLRGVSEEVFCEGGKNCEKVKYTLPKYISDDFTSSTDDKMWKTIVGAKISELCGPIASGPALHFYGSCSRLLETVDIDLREALFVQFDMFTGCLHAVENENASGDNSILVQLSCNAGITWRTLRRIPLQYHQPTAVIEYIYSALCLDSLYFCLHITHVNSILNKTKIKNILFRHRKSFTKLFRYVWIEIPKSLRCLGGRVRWWQPGIHLNEFVKKKIWAEISCKRSYHLKIKIKNQTRSKPNSKFDLSNTALINSSLLFSLLGKYCDFNESVQVLESTPSEPAVVQTTDIQITPKHSIHFRLALGCGAVWDNSIEPVSLQYSRDFGRTWNLVRELCLPFNSTSCTHLHDESVFYAPQEWQYYVFPLEHIGSSKYNRFRWIQNATADVMGSHKWALKDVYIGLSCPFHCLGRGSCINQKCICEPAYGGDHCQHIIINNVPYIKDDFKKQEFLSHWQHVQGALLASGCGEELEEPPAATFQGPHTRALMSRPVDTRSARFVLFTAQIGSKHGTC